MNRNGANRHSRGSGNPGVERRKSGVATRINRTGH